MDANVESWEKLTDSDRNFNRAAACFEGKRLALEAKKREWRKEKGKHPSLQPALPRGKPCNFCKWICG